MDNEFVRPTILVTLVLLVVVIFLGAYFRKYVQGHEESRKYAPGICVQCTHELKTPLTSIRGFVETLKDGASRIRKWLIDFWILSRLRRSA